MSTTRKLLLPVAILAIIVLGLMVSNALRDQDLRRYIEDRCWVQGGTIENGTCKLPEDKRTPQEKVCVAMKGNYVIAKDKVTGKEEFWCYSDEGKELKMPNLAGKEIVIMSDDTVVLRDKRK